MLWLECRIISNIHDNKACITRFFQHQFPQSDLTSCLKRETIKITSTNAYKPLLWKWVQWNIFIKMRAQFKLRINFTIIHYKQKFYILQNSRSFKINFNPVIIICLPLDICRFQMNSRNQAQLLNSDTYWQFFSTWSALYCSHWQCS